MQFPKKIKVLGKTFKVMLLPQKKIEELMNMSGVCGGVVYSEAVIYVSNDVAPDEVPVIFWHEFVHAVSSVAGFNQTLCIEVQEVIAESIAQAIVQLQKQLDSSIKPRKKSKHGKSNVQEVRKRKVHNASTSKTR